MSKQEIVCIGCPLGCHVTFSVKGEDELQDMTGHKCKEGEKFVVGEFKFPVRVFTATVLIEGNGGLLPVRTDKPVLKSKLKEIMYSIAKVRAKPPVRIGQEIVHNVLGTGANLVSTGILK